MAKTLIGASGAPHNSTANTTEYWMLMGGTTTVTGNTTETNVQILLRSAGTLSNLFVRLTANTCTGLVIRTRKNAANGGQTISPDASATGTFEDTSGTDTIAAGDKINLQSVPPATGTFTMRIPSVAFAATTDTVTRMGLADPTASNIATASTTWFTPLAGSSDVATSVTEAQAKTRQRKAGTFGNMCVHVTANSRTTDTTFKGRLNGADGNQSVSVGSTATGFLEDNTGTDTIAVNDDYNFAIVTGTGTQTLTFRSVLIDFTTTTNYGQCQTATAEAPFTWADNTSNFTNILGRFVGTSTESITQMLTRYAQTFSEYTIGITQNGVSSASTLKFRKNTANGTGSVSITGSTTGVFNDSSGSDTVDADDVVNYQVVIPSVAGSQTITIQWISCWTFISTATQYDRSPSADDITVSDSSLTRILSVARSPSDTANIDETLSRATQAFRAPSSDSTTVADGSLERAVVKPRTPTADDITISDSSLTRLLSATRLPSTEITSISDSSLTRILSALRIPSSETVTVADASLEGIIVHLYERAPSADDITIADSSLTRLYSALRLPSTDSVSISDASLTRLYSALRLPSTDTVTLSENIDITLSGRISRNVEDTVSVTEQSLNRMLSLIRNPSGDTSNINEQLTRVFLYPRLPSGESVTVSDTGQPTRILLLSRSAFSDTSSIVEQSLTRFLQTIRQLQDTTAVTELQSLILHIRSLNETINVTEPILSRIVTSIRLISDDTEVTESVFYETFKRLLIESVSVNESLFYERDMLGGFMSYATPSEIRPLLGNIAGDRNDPEIILASQSAYAEINRRTNRIPPNDWKDTEPDFSTIKKIARLTAVTELAIGIKDFDTKEIDEEIEELYKLIETHRAEGSTSDLVVTSSSETYAASEQGLIWSTRYRNLRKNPRGQGLENSVVVD